MSNHILGGTMIARFVILMCVAVLALPVATLTRPGETGPSLWSDAAVDAKGKKHKHKKPKFKTVTRTVRQPVTETFTSIAPITIPGFPEGTAPASPYPTAIAVSDFSHGTITDVNLILTDFTHAAPEKVEILLSTDDGRRALVFSGASAAASATNLIVTLDDEAAMPLPALELSSGTFQPFDHDPTPDIFGPPAPAPDGAVALSTFDGADPNGTWRLWVMGGGSINKSGIDGGWALEITAEVDVQVDEQVRIKDKQHKKKHKKRH
jgi:hypothetical protein